MQNAFRLPTKTHGSFQTDVKTNKSPKPLPASCAGVTGREENACMNVYMYDRPAARENKKNKNKGTKRGGDTPPLELTRLHPGGGADAEV